MTPTDPKKPGDADRSADSRRGPRPGGHGSYKLGGEPATGHSWDSAPPPPPPASGRYAPPPPPARYDDGVPHDPHAPGDPLHNEDILHEHADVNIRAVIVSAVIMCVVVIISQVGMWVLFGVLEDEARGNDPIVSPLSAAPTTMPKNQVGQPVFAPETVAGPPLLTNEPMALAKQRDVEQQRLHGYGWVNQGAGVAHMPIEQAKKLILGRLPVREGEAVSPTLGTGLPAQGESSGGRIITTPTAETPESAAPTAPEGGHGQQPSGHQPAPSHGEQPTAKPQGRGGH
jgi:hypothetical protein